MTNPAQEQELHRLRLALHLQHTSGASMPGPPASGAPGGKSGGVPGPGMPPLFPTGLQSRYTSEAPTGHQCAVLDEGRMGRTRSRCTTPRLWQWLMASRSWCTARCRKITNAKKEKVCALSQ